ncbi:MAG: pilus assembly protein [Archangiaceae bacterium]|nr:pilus assembly protein [Archangiaceae bacterium]
MSARGQSGQAAVETALILPLFLFMVLGTLQLFLMLQARLMVEHAAFTATRTGSLSQGSCTRMKHAALLTLLPTFTAITGHGDPASRLVDAFGAHRANRYQPLRDAKHDGDIVWLFREVPGARRTAGTDEDDGFDDPDEQETLTLETRLVFWYPMRIPFANWVIARLVVAAWGGRRYEGVGPLAPTQTQSWGAVNRPVDAQVFNALQTRTGAPASTYVFPIQASAAMRMLTSPRLGRGFIFRGVCR